ncbi:hypothetical protein JCM3775_001308 [Rhodotorula graminis]
MPPSPPLIQVDPDSTSLDHLLHVLDAATTAAAPLPGQPAPSSAAPPTRRRRRLDDSPPLATHLDDLAANTLAMRHAARRQRELEWDERDNLDRARRALLSSLAAADHPVRLSTSNDGEDEGDRDLDHLTAAERFFHMATDLVGAGAGDDDDNMVGESDDDDMMDDDGWADAGHVDDFHLVGFDGDMFDAPDDADSGDDDALLGEVWAQPRPAGAAAHSSSTDFRAMLPGFAGERFLNPVHVAPSDTYSAPVPSPDPVVPYLSRDPSSALSFTSFLQPGATFVGEQTFGTRSRTRVQHGPHASLDGAAPELAWADPADIALAVRSAAAARAGAASRLVSTAHPEFAPQPSGAGAEAASGAAQSTGPGALRNAPPPWRAAASAWEDGSALAVPRATASGGAGARAGAAAESRARASGSSSTRAETDPLLAILRGHTSPSSRYAPYSSSSSTSTHAPVATHPAGAGSPSSTSPSAASAPAASLSPNAAAARARARVAQSVNPAARASRSSWGEVGEELLLRAVAREREREAERERGAAKGRGGPEPESWSVKVTVLSYEPELKSLTGVMRAHGVAIPPVTVATSSTSSDASPPPPPVGDVTTFFSGSILHPIVDGLFCSPSPTGSGGEFCVTRSSEAESWVQLGPFKGLTKRELLEGAKSRVWVEEKTRGWVLCRWKERDFVNVTANESSLSISGFYHVVLDRQTGAIEGLYHDPAATPHQRLVLSPADNERGAFGLGSFAYR